MWAVPSSDRACSSVSQVLIATLRPLARSTAPTYVWLPGMLFYELEQLVEDLTRRVVTGRGWIGPLTGCDAHVHCVLLRQRWTEVQSEDPNSAGRVRGTSGSVG